MSTWSRWFNTAKGAAIHKGVHSRKRSTVEGVDW